MDSSCASAAIACWGKHSTRIRAKASTRDPQIRPKCLAVLQSERRTQRIPRSSRASSQARAATLSSCISVGNTCFPRNISPWPARPAAAWVRTPYRALDGRGNDDASCRVFPSNITLSRCRENTLMASVINCLYIFIMIKSYPLITIWVLTPGQRAKKWLAPYGERLVCRRYRDDAPRKKGLKASELISEETVSLPPSAPSGRREVGSQEMRLGATRSPGGGMRARGMDR